MRRFPARVSRAVANSFPRIAAAEVSPNYKEGSVLMWGPWIRGGRAH